MTCTMFTTKEHNVADYKVQFVHPDAPTKTQKLEVDTPVEADGPESGINNRTSILAEADMLVNGDRNIDYGDPIDDFRRTADMWSAYLNVPLKPHDVAVLMTMLKLSRIKWSPNKRDHWADAGGYIACGFDCTLREGS